MAVLIGVVALGLVAVLVVGGLTGRIRLSNGCCAPADPARDLRMRAVLEEQEDSDRPPAERPDTRLGS